MKNAIEIMELPVNPKNERLISVKAAIAQTVFSVTSRTDPTQLKGLPKDKVGEILDRIRAEGETEQ